MTLVFNISGLLVLAGLIGIYLGLGRRPRGTFARSGRSAKSEKEGRTAPRSR